MFKVRLVDGWFMSIEGYWFMGLPIVFDDKTMVIGKKGRRKIEKTREREGRGKEKNESGIIK